MEYSQELMGRRLHSGLIDKGIKQQDLAKRVGVSAEVVANWISGRTPIPFACACEICDLLGWPLDRLAVRETTYTYTSL